MLSSGESFGTIRNKVTRRLELLTFARLLWELFKALIFGVLNQMKAIIDSATIEMIKQQRSQKAWDRHATHIDTQAHAAKPTPRAAAR